MLELITFFYNHRQNACYLNIRDFAKQLQFAVTNKLPIETIKITHNLVQNQKVDYYLKQFNLNDLAESEQIFKNIREYLNENKYAMSKERKIEIFGVWFYWLSISNINAWVIYNDSLKDEQKIDINNYSFEDIHKFARDILFEEESLSVCYNYKIDINDFKQNEASLVKIQPDIFTRAIFSQSVENVQLLIDNGIDLNRFRIYPFKTYRSPLILCFYCNNIEIFNLLIQNQFKIDDFKDFFYNPTLYKDFKFSLYLHYLKQGNYAILNSLKFDESQFLTSFKLYEHLKTKQEIFELYKSLFDIGFLIDFKTNIYEYYFMRHEDEKEPYVYNQLLPCINQNGISTIAIQQIIEFLKLAYKSHSFKTQQYLIKLLNEIILTCQHNIYYLTKPKLKPKELITILSTILPMINERYLNEMITYYEIDLNFIMNGFFKEILNPDFYAVLEEGANFSIENVYDWNGFKLIDVLVKYKLISTSSLATFLEKLISSYYKIGQKNVEISFFSAFMFYFWDNCYIDRNEYSIYTNKICSRISNKFKVEAAKVVTTLFLYIPDFNDNPPESLLSLSRKAIRRSMKGLSDENLSKLNLPNHLLAYVAETIKSNNYDDTFHKMCKSYLFKIRSNS